MSNNNDLENESEVEASVVDDTADHDVLDAIDSDDIAVLKAEISALRETLAIEEKKAEDNYQLALRTKAEADNIKRRSENDVSNARKFGIEKFANEMLPVIDSLEMGLAAASDENASVEKFREGTEMTIKMFMSAVEKFGVAVVDPQGEKFDPEFHQAMSMQESADVAPNTVLNVFQKGYTLAGRLMRPAMVIVSKAGEAPPEKPSIDETV
jgi:molecular chaperone GrpE